MYYFELDVKKQRCAVNVDTVLLLSLPVKVEILNLHSSPLIMAQVMLLRILDSLPKAGHSS